MPIAERLLTCIDRIAWSQTRQFFELLPVEQKMEARKRLLKRLARQPPIAEEDQTVVETLLMVTQEPGLDAVIAAWPDKGGLLMAKAAWLALHDHQSLLDPLLKRALQPAVDQSHRAWNREAVLWLIGILGNAESLRRLIELAQEDAGRVHMLPSALIGHEGQNAFSGKHPLVQLVEAIAPNQVVARTTHRNTLLELLSREVMLRDTRPPPEGVIGVDLPLMMAPEDGLIVDRNFAYIWVDHQSVAAAQSLDGIAHVAPNLRMCDLVCMWLLRSGGELNFPFADPAPVRDEFIKRFRHQAWIEADEAIRKSGLPPDLLPTRQTDTEDF